MEPSFITADHIIDEVLTDTYDEGGVLREKCYRWLFRVWKQITQDFIPDTHRIVLPVNKNTKTVMLPPDFVEWVTIGYIKCNKIYHLKINDRLPPVNIEDKRVCPTCHQVDLCKVVYETITEEIEIEGENYIKTIERMINSEGNYIELVKEPVFTPTGVVFRESSNTVCKLEKSKCGCICPSKANITTLVTNGCSPDLCCCGSGWNWTGFESCGLGTFNVFKEEGFIQLSHDSPLESIYLVYNGNGLREGGKYYFPDDAEEALIAGTYYRSIQKKKNIPEVLYRRAKRDWLNELSLLQRRTGRISVQELRQIFNRKPQY